MKKALIVVLFTLILFFIANFSASSAPTPTAKNAHLNVSKTLTSAVKNDDGSYTVEYKIIVKNTGSVKVNKFNIQDDLNKAFKGYPFNIIYKTINELEPNPSYDGKGNVKLLKDGLSLDKGKEVEIKLKVQFFPGKDKGPFENFVEASGSLADGTPIGTNPEPPKEPPGTGGGGNPNPVEPEPVKPEPPETNLEPRKFEYIVVDVKTGKELMKIKPGDVIDVGKLPTKNITIKININPGNKGSLKILENGKNKSRIENGAPYATGPNEGGKYSSWPYELGDQSITVIAYTEKNAKGKEINRDTINFKIVDSTAEPPKEEDLTSESDKVTFTFPEEPIDETPIEDIPPIDETPEEEVPPIEETPGEEVPNEEKPKEDEIPLVIVDESDEEENEAPGRVLAATGIGLTESLIIGLIIVIAVLELNFFDLENKLALNLIGKIKKKFSKE